MTPDIWPRHYPDLSSNNGAVNIAAVVGAGLPVVAVKATEGAGYVNPAHADQAREVHALHTGVVHYHFCRPGSSSVAHEAAWFWAAVQPVWRPWDRLMLDLEVPVLEDYVAGLSPAAGYLRELEGYLHGYDQNPVIGYTFEANYSDAGLRGALHSRHWCIADFSVPAGDARVTAPDELWSHQYTQTGRWPGVAGACDVNLMASRHALAASIARTWRERRGVV